MFQCDDTRGCVMQFWPPDDEHVCSKHVEAWNKLIVKQKFCASSWLITEINILRYTVSKTSTFSICSYPRSVSTKFQCSYVATAGMQHNTFTLATNKKEKVDQIGVWISVDMILRWESYHFIINEREAGFLSLYQGIRP